MYRYNCIISYPDSDGNLQKKTSTLFVRAENTENAETISKEYINKNMMDKGVHYSYELTLETINIFPQFKKEKRLKL